jgi:CheY-like chemotaxis protein
MPSKKKIIILEDNDLYRSVVKKLINAQSDMEVVAEAADGIEAFEVLERHAADLVLLDLRLPGSSGYEILRDAGRNPGMKILVLTALEAEDNIRAALDAGADGYCFKDVGSTELLKAISTVLSGERYVSKGAMGRPDEKRREDRQRCDCSIHWTFFNKMDLYPGRLINCSRDGIFFETSQAVLEGSTLMIRLERCLRDAQRKSPSCLRSGALAEVKWIRKQGKVHFVGARYHYPA